VNAAKQGRMQVKVSLESWPMIAPVKIAGHTFNELAVVVATLSTGGFSGRGEAIGIFYHGDSPPKIAAEIESVRGRLENGVSREELRSLLRPGGACNAVDCALWDLESKQSGKPVWQLAELNKPQPLLTTYTLGADAPDVMADIATTRYRDAKAIKLKLLGDGQDDARVRAVRAARTDVWIGVDANQGFTHDLLVDLMPSLIEARVSLIEQPYKIGEESQLDALKSPIPLAADESLQSFDDVATLVGRFQVMNIKLDKCGGLTEALLMAQEGQRLGLQIMVGNMGGTSLAMAPATLLGQYCDIVDLDGPLFLTSDRRPSVIYDRGLMTAPEDLWGGGARAVE
jgi:L-alanine-DL-glutamate epimerase-like enolase superfamily enzyme